MAPSSPAPIACPGILTCQLLSCDPSLSNTWIAPLGVLLNNEPKLIPPCCEGPSRATIRPSDVLVIDCRVAPVLSETLISCTSLCETRGADFRAEVARPGIAKIDTARTADTT